jgi:hypothetical protein
MSALITVGLCSGRHQRDLFGPAADKYPHKERPTLSIDLG